MGQQEVFDYLKKHKSKWHKSKEISKGLKVSIGSVTNCLKKLRKTSSIAYRETERKNQYEYKYKG